MTVKESFVPVPDLKESSRRKFAEKSLMVIQQAISYFTFKKGGHWRKEDFELDIDKLEINLKVRNLLEERCGIEKERKVEKIPAILHPYNVKKLVIDFAPKIKFLKESIIPNLDKSVESRVFKKIIETVEIYLELITRLTPLHDLPEDAYDRDINKAKEDPEFVEVIQEITNDHVLAWKILDYLTVREGEPYDKYLKRMRGSATRGKIAAMIACFMKFFDVIDNARSEQTGPRRKKKTKHFFEIMGPIFKPLILNFKEIFPDQYLEIKRAKNPHVHTAYTRAKVFSKIEGTFLERLFTLL